MMLARMKIYDKTNRGKEGGGRKEEDVFPADLLASCTSSWVQ